jgi:hypothetical protein
MQRQQQFEKLKFEPKDQILAARFTKTESKKIREFCRAENIQLSNLIRFSFKQLIKNL